jgi:hypothetical protein
MGGGMSVSGDTSFEVLDLEVWTLEADYVGVGVSVGVNDVSRERGKGGRDGDTTLGVAEMERESGEVEKIDRGRGW